MGETQSMMKGDERTPHHGGIIILYHNDFLKHDPSPYYHPENPRRLLTAKEAVSALKEDIRYIDPPLGDAYSIYRSVHDELYLKLIVSSVKKERTLYWLDPDTYVSKGTLNALNRLAGAVDLAIKLVMEGALPFILGRPPGHHAGIKGVAMGAPTLGFCILNTSALLAKLLAKHGKVAVFDFDLHHGNGTQEILWNENILHVDIHQDPRTIYPGTGFPEDIGGIKKTKINILIPPGSGDDIYKDAVEKAFTFIEEYDPDYLVVSAGFDPYFGDYGSMRATSYTFNLIGIKIFKLKSNKIIVLEGGYEAGLREGLPAFMMGLANKKVTTSKSMSNTIQWAGYREMMERLRRALD